ncbi:hypothetical protein BD410DRAFT_822616 [Rickenella mellea]|uniref:D-aminoacid aminotransferase-like PLP-dependent enzyme n=1 Tax=Rickenella mellea TaxID=50990 RepID=A0A4Y7PR46_9AGAM|nr:hypothetical protein BD410DRAFT_822616 [Rickenella mellea]
MSTSFDLFTSLRWDPILLSESFNTEVNHGMPSSFLLFPYHVDRLIHAARAFNWPKAIAMMEEPGVEKKLRGLCEQAVEEFVGDKNGGQEGGLRERNINLRCKSQIRILLSIDGSLKAEPYSASSLQRPPLAAAYFNPTALSNSSPPQPILSVHLDTQPTPSTLYTSFKTTFRAHYDSARTRASIFDRTTPREVIMYNESSEITEGSLRNVAFWREGGWVTPSLDSGGLDGTVRRYLLEKGVLREERIMKDDVKPGEWVLLSNGIDVTILGRMVDGMKTVE